MALQAGRRGSTFMRLLLSLSLLLAGACGPPTPITGNPTSGRSLYAARSCNGCHGTNGQGSSTGPNVTGSTTAGIGEWTLDEFRAAVRQAQGRDGSKLCSTMPPYPNLTEQQSADLFAYLQAQKNDTPQRGQACP